MRTLKLKKELFDMVRTGRKVATTRLGVKDVCVGLARFVDPNGSDEAVNIQINKIELVTFGDILFNNILPVLEGYRSRLEYLNAIEDIYGRIVTEQKMTIIYFTKI